MREHQPETFLCDLCHQEHPISDRTFFDGYSLCPECFEREVVCCTNCGEMMWVSDAVSDDSIVLCQRCFDSSYTTCERCGRLMPYEDARYLDDDEDYPYCQDCYDHLNSYQKFIQSYYYKPHPIFYGEGNRYFGVELEIDKAGEFHDNAKRILDIANEAAPHLYCKHDGSLREGFELVTHPMTLDYHLNSMPWAKIMEEAIHMGYLSHRTDTCGLHVHVNRDSLGETEEEQETVIARILFFVEAHWNELLKFSRRTSSQMKQWAARYGRKDSPKEVMDHVKSGSMSRYSCVNLNNETTIEFRMFRGTLRCSTLKATLQLVNEICSVAFCLSDEEIANLTWSDFVSHIGAQNLPELTAYLKERRLYVSEPVQGEEEI